MKRFFALSVVAILLLTACGKDEKSDSKYFDYKLRGTWVSNDPEAVYHGTLTIDYNKIIITGYGELQTPLNGDDMKRPFRDFPKGTPLSGYSENNNTMFIMDAGQWRAGIPYIYSEENYGHYKLLRFNFGGRTEILMPEIVNNE
jgi:hypothetical protein